MTPASTPCYCTTALVLGGFALANLALIAALVAIGIRSLALGRDVVWECRWQLPVRIAQSVAALWRWRSMAPNANPLSRMRPQRFGKEGWAAPTTLRWLAGMVVLPVDLRSAGGQAGGRRPVRAQHYLTVGERMRAEPRRWAV